MALLQRWPDWAGSVAAAWSLGYGALGLYWTMGGAGFPFGIEHDPGGRLSVLARARQDVAAPVIATLGLMGAANAIAMARVRGVDSIRTPLLAFAWTAALALAVVVPDFRVLVVVAYAPILLIGAPFDWPGSVRVSDALPWPVLNQAVCIAGGLAWAATGLAYQRRSRGACAHCGRADAVAGWTTPGSAERWGRWAIYTAMTVPLIYALTRFAWALGIPLGITRKFFREGQAIGLWWRGAALGALAVVGALLTLGLGRRWGEVFPRWLPGFGGRKVPLLVVVIPAAIMSVLVTTAGLMFLRMGIAGTFRLGDNVVTFRENWAALWPELVWPIWGVALSAATLAYYYRTRGRCEFCGRL